PDRGSTRLRRFVTERELRSREVRKSQTLFRGSQESFALSNDFARDARFTRTKRRRPSSTRNRTAAAPPPPGGRPATACTVADSTHFCPFHDRIAHENGHARSGRHLLPPGGTGGWRGDRVPRVG